MGSHIRLAVMGGGYWGRNLIRNFSALEGVEVKLLCELNEEALMECKGLYPSLETSGDLGRILQDDAVDGVVVVTPPSLHYGPAEEPLRATCLSFITAITEGRESPSSGRNSLRTLKVLEAGEVSLRAGGRRVSIGEVG